MTTLVTTDLQRRQEEEKEGRPYPVWKDHKIMTNVEIFDIEEEETREQGERGTRKKVEIS
jgi:hypothetical protein